MSPTEIADEAKMTQPPRGKVPWFPAAFLLLVLGLALFGDKGLLRALQAGRQQQQLEAELQRQEATSAQLRREIEALRSDRRYLEVIARRELGMVRDGELVYKFPTPNVQP